VTFGLALEPFPLVALALAATLALVPGARRLLVAGTPATFTLIASGLAALLSAAYVSAYLRGGPRIVDASTYYLQARALSEGHLAWVASEPSEVGRFLVRDSLGEGTHVAGIFPPGYPAVLALGFWVGAPMAVGPALAFAVTWWTGFLARAALASRGDAGELAARTAVTLSVVCAALRYHTADTMSHGLAAVCVAGALGCALCWRNTDCLRSVAGAGAFVGLLCSSRPVSGGALALVTLFAVGRRLTLRTSLIALAAATPFVALLLAHQHAATGAWWSSSQSLYYATSDGPNGCFRYGFGAGIGCLHEHGDFVRHNLGHGYDLTAVLGTTLRRLKLHGVDALNAEPFALLLIPALWLALKNPALRPVALLPLALIAAYAPFYFDGNYPAGGARFFADGLPTEHVLAGWFSVFVVLPRLGRQWPARPGLASPHWLLVLSLLGFAFRAHNEHAALRDREGGRPMFEPAALDRAGVTTGLVFLNTDHGFSLAFDPEPAALRFARRRGDHFDWMTWQAAGRPPAYFYRYASDSGLVTVVPFLPERGPIIEGANLWPPFAQRGAFALPAHVANSCHGETRGLTVEAGRTETEPTVELALPRQLAGDVVIPVVRYAADVVLELYDGSTLLRRWEGAAGGPICRELEPVLMPDDETVDDSAFRLRVLLPRRFAGETSRFELRAIAVAASVDLDQPE